MQPTIRVKVLEGAEEVACARMWKAMNITFFRIFTQQLQKYGDYIKEIEWSCKSVRS